MSNNINSGGFESDHGLATEDESCEDCCSGFVDIVGESRCTNGQKSIRLTILHEEGNMGNMHSMVWLVAAIEFPTEDVVKLRQTFKESGTVHTFEFRKR